MKKNLFFLFALICSMSLFTACSDDDPDYTPVIEEEIAGNYKGVLGVSINGQQVAQNIPQRISVSGAGATSINLSLTNFSFSGIQVGDVALQNCPMTQNGNTYDFTGATNLNITGLTASVNATGNIGNGTVSITMDIDATLGTVEQTVVVTYTGTKLSGTEGTGAEITGFTFDSEAVTEAPVIDGTNITFKVAEGADITALAPTITISEGATVTPASGVAQDFSNGKTVKYTVVSEDYGTTKIYTASVSASQTILSYNFDEWTVMNAGKSNEYQTPNPVDVLATSNGGAELLNMFSSFGFPVSPEENGYSGKAAKLVTMDSRGTLAEYMGAVVTSGSLFTGKFELNAMAPLQSTQFGIAYDKKPITFSGVYKYTPGTPFINGANGEDESITDECSIVAVLYEATDAAGEEVILNGTNINGSEYHVAVAALEDGSAKADWTEFNIPFTFVEGKSYEEGKAYKLAIVCSSSKNGDKYQGGVNSTLIVDNLQVIGE